MERTRLDRSDPFQTETDGPVYASAKNSDRYEDFYYNYDYKKDNYNNYRETNDTPFDLSNWQVRDETGRETKTSESVDSDDVNVNETGDDNQPINFAYYHF
ncbi:jg3089 [Pararge aegeria aegeria]|uniref:Jg3089 protein n=1 Tax=Pararge aegeria aegeria TaxID=348720 RepID=A0A8S4QJQ1_9NEOP|nr:jg3089 [Pararge aegeria aegeria]